MIEDEHVSQDQPEQAPEPAPDQALNAGKSIFATDHHVSPDVKTGHVWMSKLSIYQSYVHESAKLGHGVETIKSNAEKLLDHFEQMFGIGGKHR